MQNAILSRIIGAIFGKRRVIGWGAAVAMAIGAAAMGMQTSEFKSAVCDAPVLEQPTEAAK